MKRLQVSLPDQDALESLDRLYHTTRDARLRTRALIVLLAVERQMVAAEIASIVRTDEQTVRRWLKRYQEQGLDGLYDAQRPGGPRKVTDAYLTELTEAARRAPSELGLPHTHWTAERLAEHMASRTQVEVHPETVRLHLKAAGINLGSVPKSASPSPKSRSTSKEREPLK